MLIIYNNESKANLYLNKRLIYLYIKISKILYFMQWLSFNSGKYFIKMANQTIVESATNRKAPSIPKVRKIVGAIFIEVPINFISYNAMKRIAVFLNFNGTSSLAILVHSTMGPELIIIE